MSDDCDRLIDAIHAGDIAHAKKLIETGLDLNTPCDDGATPIFAAIMGGHTSLVRRMLELGASPNFLADEPAATLYAERPLELAMQSRHLVNWDKYHPIVEVLLQFGATDAEGNAVSSDTTDAERLAREWQKKYPAD